MDHLTGGKFPPRRSIVTEDTYRESLVNFRGRDLLRQAIAKYDGNLDSRGWIILSAAALLFASGVTLGAILQMRYPDTNEVVFTAAVIAGLTLFLLGLGVSLYLESITNRRAKFIETLESYMDAQHDVAKYDREVSR
tara:strand:- start:83 stop:493 length:411 start_codon:yes stop_codon:yes gene_type:complete